MADTATLTPPARAPQRPAPRDQARADYVNVSDTERWLSVLGGGALTVFGLTRGSAGGLALALAGGACLFRGVTGHCHLYETLGVNTSREGHGPATSVPARHGFKVEKSITINRAPEELYQFWRNLSNLPRFMNHLQSVTDTGDKRSHWVARGPLGSNVEWDAEIITEKENELIGWRSLPGATVDNAGSVHFQRAPGGRGTEVKVSLKYDPPAGKVGAVIAKLFGQAPEQQIQEDLRCLKQIMETGEVSTTAGQPQGQC